MDRDNNHKASRHKEASDFNVWCQDRRFSKRVPQRIRIGNKLKGIAGYRLVQQLPQSLRKVRALLLPWTFPTIVAEVLRQTGVPDTQEIGDHEPVDHGNQSSFGASSGQYGVVLTIVAMYSGVHDHIRSNTAQYDIL